MAGSYHGEERLIPARVAPRVRTRVLINKRDGSVIFPVNAPGLDDEEFFRLVDSRRASQLVRDEWLVHRCELRPEWDPSPYIAEHAEAFALGKFFKARTEVVSEIRKKFADFMAERFPPYVPPPPPHRDPWASIEWEPPSVAVLLEDFPYHYGPTPTDPDPGKKWHIGCGGEVLFIEDGLICAKCGAQAEG